MLQSGKKNCVVQWNCCNNQFWKLFIFFATVLIQIGLFSIAAESWIRTIQ